MKKSVCIISLILAGAAGVYGADFSLSAGGGAHAGGLFTRYTLTANGKIEGETVSVNAGQEMNQRNFGGFLFIDGTWAEFSVGVQSGTNTFNEKIVTASPSIGNPTEIIKGRGRETMLTFALTGKYPFKLSDRFALSPLAGLEYQIALMQRRHEPGYSEYDRTNGERESDVDGEPYKLSTWNSLFVNIGVGMDIDLVSSLFLRTELFYGFRLKTFYEEDALKKVKENLNAADPKLGGLTGGPILRVAAGWRFF